MRKNEYGDKGSKGGYKSHIVARKTRHVREDDHAGTCLSTLAICSYGDGPIMRRWKTMGGMDWAISILDFKI